MWMYNLENLAGLVEKFLSRVIVFYRITQAFMGPMVSGFLHSGKNFKLRR